MVGAGRWLVVTLRPLQRQSLVIRRGIKCSAVSRQGDDASPSSSSQSPSLDVVAALRRNVGQQGSRGGGRPQQDRGDRSQQNRGAQQRTSQFGAKRPSRTKQSGDRPPRRDDRGQRQGQDQGQRRPDRRDGQSRGQRSASSPRRRGPLPARRDQESEVVSLSPTPIQSVYPVTDWQHAASSVSVGFARVPYTTPAVSIGSLNKSKNTRPLHEADKAIRLHGTKSGTVVGPVNDPTPTARPRRRSDDAPVLSRTGSIAQEAKEGRIKFIQEKFGGDYQRWDRKELLKSLQGQKLNLVEEHAAEALVRNTDLGPRHKAWTLITINTILKGKRAQ
jgi:hypothetical protein